MAGDSVRQQAQILRQAQDERARVGAGTHTASKLWSRGGRGLRAFSRFPYIPIHGGNVVKTTVGRLLAGAFALALLVAVGLSTHGSAQAAPGDFTIPNKYLCSLAACATAGTNASGDIAVEGGLGETLEVLNLDVAKVTGVNPRDVIAGNPITVVQAFTSPNADGTPSVSGEIRAFNGNRIQITYTPTSGFAKTATILVDNVKPTLVTTSPDIPLVTKKGVNITFSAELTDGGSGYTTTVGTSGTSDIDDLNSTPGALASDTNVDTPRGGVRLVVAGNVVALGKDDFEAIDGGWRVSKEIGSSAIQNIGANVPWYFETSDRAGNERRTSGSISLNGVVTGGNGTGGATDARFAGTLPADSFVDTMVKVTRGSASKTVPITSFTNTTGAFILNLTAAAPNDFFADDATTSDVTESDVLEGDKMELVGSNLLTIDGVAPSLGSPKAITGVVYSTSKKMAVRGLSAKANSIQVNFTDDGKTDGDGAGSGLDAASVTPAAFTVAGNTVNSVSVQGNSVYLTLGTNLAPDETPVITIANGSIMDKAGNAFGGSRIAATEVSDGLGPNLSLSEDSDLSKEKVTVTIMTDEQLASLPDVMLSRVINNNGDVVVRGAQECVYAAVAATTDTPPLPALPAVTRAVTVADDGTVSCAAVADTDPMLNARYQATTPSGVAGQPAGAPSPSQTEALSYSYAVTAATANPVGDDVVGGKYNVYVEGVDTQNAENKGKAGHASDANHSAAFTFQLDTKLNGGDDPMVTVSDETAAGGDADAPDVETISPMIVTVDWAGEAGEYPGDSYRTVELTEAKLTISFSDGSSESRTFDLAAEISTQDSRKYTIPVLNPKVGVYTLTVKGTDSAGNASGTSGHSATWNVVAAKPVEVALKPGWNLISLPFQPANPAINSVIPTDHPVGLVMTFDGAEGVWLFSRRDAETGLFVGDVSVITASSAYFVNTDSFKALSLFRPPSATAAAAPAQPPAIPVSAGWNLVPVSSNQTPVPASIGADTYFGTLGDTWLRALAWDPLARTWIAVAPSKAGAPNSGGTIGDEGTATDRCGTEHKGDEGDNVPAQVCTGQGMWLWVTEDGTLIPG